MKTNHPDIPWLPPEYFENQQNIPWEMLEPYVNQHIAWNWEGNVILAGAPTREELYDKLEAQGIDTNRVVFSFVPDPNISYM